MISCLLKQVTRNRKGLASSKDISVTGETMDIGRAPVCKIHLLDHQAFLHHATITRADDGTLQITGVGEAEISIDGTPRHMATLQPGMQIGIGAYQLRVEPSSDPYDLILQLEWVQAQPQLDSVNSIRSRWVSIDGLLLSKRKLGYGLALVILFFFLLLPLLPSTSVAIDRWQAQLPVSFSAAWRVGTISDAHSQFGAQCSTCHERPFTAISDDACLKCHQHNTQHRGSAAASSPKVQQATCSTCHLEHQGRHKLVLHDAQQCVACHADIQGKAPAAKVANVRDFGEDHPEFHLTLSTGTQTTRLSQSDPGKLKENPALKFSHKVHLDKAGLSTPDGEKVMKCPDCHKLDPAARRFIPITMRTTCQQSECHSPDYSLPAKGPVVHGSVKQVMSSLQLFYARWLSQSPANMASCELRATASNQNTRIVDCAFDLARKNAAENLFGGKTRCGECHDIQPSDDAQAPWSIASPQIQRDWHAGAVFPHTRHATMVCTDCHDKLNSESSADVAIPDLTKCRQCHSGAESEQGKISTNCHSCHQYHPAEQPETQGVVARR